MSDIQKCISPECANGGLQCLGGRCRECKASADRFEQEHGTEAVPLVTNDPVNHPPHYSLGKFDVLDVIEEWGLNYSRSCVIEYIARAGAGSDELEDLRNAAFYLQREIARLEAKQP